MTFLSLAIDPLSDGVVLFSMYLFWASGYADMMWQSAKANRWGLRRHKVMRIPDMETYDLSKREP